jgi:hypothetical protein
MPIFFRLDDLGEPVENAEDADETQDRRRLRWARWMRRNRRRRVTREVRFGGGFWQEPDVGVTVITEFVGLTELRRNHPDFPRGIWRTKLFASVPRDHALYAYKVFRGSRAAGLASNAAAIQLARDAGLIDPADLGEVITQRPDSGD